MQREMYTRTRACSRVVHFELYTSSVCYFTVVESFIIRKTLLVGANVNTRVHIVAKLITPEITHYTVTFFTVFDVFAIDKCNLLLY